MRTLSKNKQTMKYALWQEEIIIYETDENGNIVYIEVDGEQVPVEASRKSGYGEPIDFVANISTSGSGDATEAEWGIDKSDYNALIVANKGEFPFDEQTLIFHNSEPKFDEYGALKPESADYHIIAIRPSLNQVKYILKENVK